MSDVRVYVRHVWEIFQCSLLFFLIAYFTPDVIREPLTNKEIPYIKVFGNVLFILPYIYIYVVFIWLDELFGDFEDMETGEKFSGDKEDQEKEEESEEEKEEKTEGMRLPSILKSNIILHCIHWKLQIDQDVHCNYWSM